MSDKQDTSSATASQQTRAEAQRQQRDAVRAAADAYRANLIAAAPPLPPKPAQSETQKRRSSQRI